MLLLIKVPNLSILLYLEIFLKMSILLKKMSILLKKTYQNPFVELYYEQKNATQIVCKKWCFGFAWRTIVKPSIRQDDVLCAGTDKEGKSVRKIMTGKSLPSLLLTSRFTMHMNESITSLYIYLYTTVHQTFMYLYVCHWIFIRKMCYLNLLFLFLSSLLWWSWWSSTYQ